jgi:hypothetical protein
MEIQFSPTTFGDEMRELSRNEITAHPRLRFRLRSAISIHVIGHGAQEKVAKPALEALSGSPVHTQI